MNDFPIFDEIYILKHRKSCYFSSSPIKKSCRLLSVVSYHHELGVELIEKSFDSFSEFLVCPCWLFPILLIQPTWYFQGYFCHIEKILLHLRTEIIFVSKHHAIMILPLHIIEIMNIVNIGSCHVKRMDDTAYTTDCVELAVIVDAQRRTVAPLWGALIINFAHSTTFVTGIPAHFNQLGVNAEYIFIAIHIHGYVFAYLLAENGSEFLLLIILTSGNQVG